MGIEGASGIERIERAESREPDLIGLMRALRTSNLEPRVRRPEQREQVERREGELIREIQERSFRLEFASLVKSAIPAGRKYSRAAGITALGAAVAASWVMAVVSLGPAGAAAAALGKVADFGVGYFVGLYQAWRQRHPEAVVSEETIRTALVEELSIRLGVQDGVHEERLVSEAHDNIRILFNDDELVALALEAAVIHAAELNAFQPSERSDAANPAGESDKWLFEEVVEALKFLAGLPSSLELALERVLNTIRRRSDGSSAP